MSKSEIILVGGGGHCRSCIDVIEQEGKFTIKGIIDLPELLGSEVFGYPVIGVDEELPILAKKGYNFLITLGFFGDSDIRKELFKTIIDNGGKFPVITSPLAYVSKHSTIGNGTIIMHNVVVNANTIIGENNIINSKALIEHDCIIGDNNHISTSSVLNGNCKVGNSCLVGSGSVLKHNILISNNTILGAGSVVVKDISEKGIYAGVPVKKIR
jgi:sugar O-acyltransferase (sialic acid O-acetyltransferase NeuD family)